MSMKHILVQFRGQDGLAAGFIVPDNEPEDRTVLEYSDAGCATSGPWRQCGQCQEWKSEWGYGNTQREHFRCDLTGRYFCEACSRRRGGGPGELPVVTAKVPAEYMSTSFEWLIANGMLCKQKAVTRGVVAQLKRWPKEQPFVLLVGAAGIGKTSAAWAIVKAQAIEHREVTVIDCLELRSRWNTPYADARERVITQATRVQFAILDEFSGPQASQPWNAAMHRLLNERLQAQRPTIIISRIPPQKLPYGEDVTSRLNRFQWVGCDGVDRRSARIPGETPDLRIVPKTGEQQQTAGESRGATQHPAAAQNAEQHTEAVR